MSVELVFRLATPADADGLAALINAAFRVDSTAEVYVDGGDRSGTHVTSATAIRAKTEQPPDEAVVFVATAAGGDPAVLLGHASLTRREAGAVAWLGSLAVAAGHHGAGLGGQLLAHAEQHARDCWHAHRLEFDVIATRAGLRAFYEKRGCRPKLDGAGCPVTAPFPYAAHGDAWHGVLQPDLDFVVYSKTL